MHGVPAALSSTSSSTNQRSKSGTLSLGSGASTDTGNATAVASRSISGCGPTARRNGIWLVSDLTSLLSLIYFFTERLIHLHLVDGGATRSQTTCVGSRCLVAHREFFSLKQIGGLERLDAVATRVLKCLGQGNPTK